MITITKKKWQSIPHDYKGIWHDYNGEKPEWIGKKTVMGAFVSDNACDSCALLIEGVHFTIE